MPSTGTQTTNPTPAPSQPAIPSANLSPPVGSWSPPAPSSSAPGSIVPRATGIAAEVEVPGSLTVCTALVGAPATSVDDTGHLVGYNVGFADELAARLDLDPVIQQADFNALISMVQGHTCDISVASQNITSDRSAQVSLVPYTQSKAGFPVVVQINNPEKIKALSDLCGLSVSAAAGTTNVDQVDGTGDFADQGLNDACRTAGKATIDLRTFPTETDALQALLDGTVVAYLGNSNFVTEYPGEIRTSSARLPGARQGIGIALDHPALTTAVRAALGEMINDGTYLQILRQYMPSQSVDNFSIIE